MEAKSSHTRYPETAPRPQVPGPSAVARFLLEDKGNMAEASTFEKNKHLEKNKCLLNPKDPSAPRI